MITNEKPVNFEIPLLLYLAEIITEEIPATVRKRRLAALHNLRSYLIYYAQLGYMEKLLYGIAEKKGKLIMESSTKDEFQKLQRPRCPRYDGAKFIPDKYCTPEEELICWSETSLRGPLKEEAVKRYCEVFQSVFPQKAQMISLREELDLSVDPNANVLGKNGDDKAVLRNPETRKEFTHECK